MQYAAHLFWTGLLRINPHSGELLMKIKYASNAFCLVKEPREIKCQYEACCISGNDVNWKIYRALFLLEHVHTNQNIN